MNNHKGNHILKFNLPFDVYNITFKNYYDNEYAVHDDDDYDDYHDDFDNRIMIIAIMIMIMLMIINKFIYQNSGLDDTMEHSWASLAFIPISQIIQRFQKFSSANFTAS